jgi:hypothetical protein
MELTSLMSHSGYSFRLETSAEWRESAIKKVRPKRAAWLVFRKISRKQMEGLALGHLFASCKHYLSIFIHQQDTMNLIIFVIPGVDPESSPNRISLNQHG